MQNSSFTASHELWERDTSWEGFEWIDADNRDQSILTFLRRAADGDELLVVLNFTPETYEDYRIGVPARGVYRELMSSDDERYGGSGVRNDGDVTAEAVAWNGRAASVRLRIPPLGALILRRIELLAEPDECVKPCDDEKTEEA